MHVNSRERLLADLLQHVSGIPSSAGPDAATPPAQPAAAGSSPTAVQQPPRSSDAVGWRQFAARLETPGARGDGQGSTAAHAAGHQAAAELAAPADPEEDIFEGASTAGSSRSGAAREEATMQADQEDAAAPEEGLSSVPVNEGASRGSLGAAAEQYPCPVHKPITKEDSSRASSLQGVDGQAAAATALLDPSPSCTSQDTNMAFAEPLTADADESQPMDGFEYDADSGYYYNSLIGAYYDPHNRLFGDAASGHWFSLKNGQYQVVA